MARAEGNLSDYPTLERHYNKQGTTPGYEGDHEAMAEGNISTFVQAMREFDASYGTEHSDYWYNAMAWWGSLSRATDDWKNLDPSLQSKYTSIQNNEWNYMKYLDARATYLGDKTKANRQSMNTAKGNVDWNLYKQTRTATE